MKLSEFIELHPSHKIEPEPQLMICPKAKECKTHHCQSWDGTANHWKPHTYRGEFACQAFNNCPACVPYVPEKEYPTKRLWRTDIERQWELHKASKVIESGYFCKYCGKKLTAGAREDLCSFKEYDGRGIDSQLSIRR